ncbi:MBL fold metallo-hydrolase [Brevundimonas sp. 2R-24]|uniref:MBL fold metallo-hydrolase n=1 Tax=Peiella sedimenti TaxID=3061083 RepID=A0ABT8SKX1_9CAUL|nr:MBL fold metallo-hydrolase [Caulobacteraceae bacterium XZ-24]
MSTPSPVGAFIVPVTPLQQNCTVVWCEATRKAAVIDPGGEIDAILGEIARRGLTLEKIWVTHGHLDHAGATAELKAKSGCPIEGPHRDDLFWIEKIETQGALYGMPEARTFTTDRWLQHGDQVALGDTVWEVIHCPGHTPGHVVFFNREARFAQVGDVLFKGSIGRTDFPRGNHQDLLDAITGRLWPLGDDVRFVPGHGPMSTFGDERRSNPFVSDSALRRSAD